MTSATVGQEFGNSRDVMLVIHDSRTCPKNSGNLVFFEVLARFFLCFHALHAGTPYHVLEPYERAAVINPLPLIEHSISPSCRHVADSGTVSILFLH